MDENLKRILEEYFKDTGVAIKDRISRKDWEKLDKKTKKLYYCDSVDPPIFKTKTSKNYNLDTNFKIEEILLFITLRNEQNTRQTRFYIGVLLALFIITDIIVAILLLASNT